MMFKNSGKLIIIAVLILVLLALNLLLGSVKIPYCLLVLLFIPLLYN